MYPSKNPLNSVGKNKSWIVRFVLEPSISYLLRTHVFAIAHCERSTHIPPNHQTRKWNVPVEEYKNEFWNTNIWKHLIDEKPLSFACPTFVQIHDRTDKQSKINESRLRLPQKVRECTLLEHDSRISSSCLDEYDCFRSMRPDRLS